MSQRLIRCSVNFSFPLADACVSALFRAILAMVDQQNVSLLLMQRVYIRLLVHDPRSRQCNGALRNEIHHNELIYRHLGPIVRVTQ